MTDKETKIEKAKRELQDYYKSPREKAKLANKIDEINEEFNENLIGKTTVWIESSLDRIKEEPINPSSILSTSHEDIKPYKYVRSQNKPSKEERVDNKVMEEKEKKTKRKSAPRLSMSEVIEILRFENSHVLWNRDLIYWSEGDWRELMKIKEKYMPTISKAFNELENENNIEKNVIYKSNENHN